MSALVSSSRYARPPRQMSAKTRAAIAEGPDQPPNAPSPYEGAMRHSCANERQLSASHPQLSVAERLTRFLRREHPVKTVDCVAAALTGRGHDVSRSAISKWFERASGPHCDAFAALIDVYGARLVAAVLGPAAAWASEAALSESRKKLDGEIERLKKDLGLP